MRGLGVFIILLALCLEMTSRLFAQSINDPVSFRNSPAAWRYSAE
jgi:hypothetical protein